MTGAEQIVKAFMAKGYPQWAVNVSHEPVQYYAAGREGGWEIEIDDEALEIPPDWGKEVPLPVLGTNDVYEVGHGSISAYSLKVALQVIAQLKPFERVTKPFLVPFPLPITAFSKRY